MSIAFEKKPLVLLGYDLIDHNHQEFITLIEQTLNSDDVGFTTLFDDLLAHTAAHFEQENNRWKAAPTLP